MYSIAIVDDNKVICSQIEDLLLDYQKQSKADFEISVFFSGGDLWETLNKGMEIDLLFLDIELLELSGIDVAKKIRQQLENRLMQIIFISAKERYAMELFDIQPFNFLIKPLNAEKIIKNIELALNIGAEQPDYLIYKSGKETKRIVINDIQYFESNGHKIEMYTAAGGQGFYGRLEDIYKKLEKYGFLFIHKSYLVNYSYVEFFAYESICLKSGIQLPISQSRRKIIRQQAITFEKAGVLSWD